MARSASNPAAPDGLVGPKGKLFFPAHEGRLKEPWIVCEGREPEIFGAVGCRKPPVSKARPVAIEQRFYAEPLGKATKLTKRSGALRQIHKVDLHAALLKKALGLSGIGALLAPEDLNLEGRGHSVSGSCRTGVRPRSPPFARRR
jgi:hypothetical protein